MSDLPYACRVLADKDPPAIAITGDLRVHPIFLADWQPNVLSEPFELAGNGTYRLEVTPVQARDPVLEWITCPNCGGLGSVLSIVLADVHGHPLGSINLLTMAHSMAVAIFGRYGVMVQTVPKLHATNWGSVASQFTTRNFSAGVIEWT
jgi:hypothetical protein